MSAAQLDQWRRDLLWAVTSPSPLRPDLAEMPSRHWFCEFAEALKLDNWQPSEPPPAGSDGTIGRKVGFYFEWLWQQAVLAHPDYRLLAANLPIMHHQRTLGALDLLVYNHRLRQHEHWELAIKFYLGMGNNAGFDHWIGPGLRDRLDIKWRRLCDHQLTLSAQPAARAALAQWDVSSLVRRLILKGVFFCDSQTAAAPSWLVAANPPAQWLTLSRFRKQAEHRPGDDNKTYHLLTKPHWLAVPAVGSEIPQCDPASLRLDRGPVQLVKSGGSGRRLFVVPDDWPSNARHQLPDLRQ